MDPSLDPTSLALLDELLKRGDQLPPLMAVPSHTDPLTAEALQRLVRPMPSHTPAPRPPQPAMASHQAPQKGFFEQLTEAQGQLGRTLSHPEVVQGQAAVLPELAIGAGKGLASTMFHGGDLIRQATGMPRVIDRPEVQAGITPMTPLQDVGFGAEHTAEFALPATRIGTASKGLPLFTQLMRQAGVASGVTAAQGGDARDTIMQAGMAAVPLGEATGAAHLRVAPVERVNGRLIVSTRVPWAKRAVTAADGPLFTGVADAAHDPELMRKFADHLRQQPVLRESEKRLSDAGVLQAFANVTGQNLDALVAMQPKEVAAESAKWYQGAHDISDRFSAGVGVHPDQGVAVMASQSPGTEWPVNVSLADRIMRGWKAFGAADTPFDQTVFDQFVKTTQKTAEEEIISKHLVGEAAAKIKARAAAKITDAQQYVGWRWNDLPLKQQARMMRAHNELNEPQTFPIWSPDGQIVTPVAMTTGSDPFPRVVKWQSYENIGRALSVLHDGSDANISLQVGEGHKVRSFFNNLNVPEDPRSVTVDTHNVGGAMYRPMGASAPEVHFVMKGPGSAATGISGAHPIYRDSVTEAARLAGLRPNQTQSVTWEGIKGLFSRAQRSHEPFKAEVARIWTEYSRGKIGLEEAHARIHDLAGGFTNPEWFKPKSGAASK